jgi:hypothetical protein
MGIKKKIKLISKMSANYNTTSAYADITGLKVVCSKTGFYRLNSIFIHYLSGTGRGAYFSFAINGNRTAARVLSYGTIQETYFPVCLYEDNIYLKKGDIVTVQAMYLAGATTIYLSNPDMIPFLSITEE